MFQTVVQKDLSVFWNRGAFPSFSISCSVTPKVDNAELLPLMEGEGRAFRVLGYNQSQRAQFVQILMRFGVGDFDWSEFTSRLKQKSYEESKVWCSKRLRIEDVLVRIAVLLLVRDKVSSKSRSSENHLHMVDFFTHLSNSNLLQQVAYENAMVAKHGEDSSSHPLFDNQTLFEVTGGKKKGGIFGFGSISDPESFLTGSSSTATSR